MELRDGSIGQIGRDAGSYRSRDRDRSAEAHLPECIQREAVRDLVDPDARVPAHPRDLSRTTVSPAFVRFVTDLQGHIQHAPVGPVRTPDTRDSIAGVRQHQYISAVTLS